MRFSGVFGGHLGFLKSDVGGERPPGLNFIDTLRTIEKSKQTIVNRANKVMGPASRLLDRLQQLLIRSMQKPESEMEINMTSSEKSAEA